MSCAGRSNAKSDTYSAAYRGENRTRGNTSYALRTADGGAVTLYGGGFRRDSRSSSQFLEPSTALITYTGPRKCTHLRSHYVYQGAAYLPKKGKAKVLGWTAQIHDGKCMGKKTPFQF